MSYEGNMVELQNWLSKYFSHLLCYEEGTRVINFNNLTYQ